MSFWKVRQNTTMTSVSSAVTMTTFEPVLVASNACMSKRVRFLLCVDYRSATSAHSSRHLVTGFFTGHNSALPCLATILYRGHSKFLFFHQELDEAGLVTATALELSPLLDVVCVPLQGSVLNGCVFTHGGVFQHL